MFASIDRLMTAPPERAVRFDNALQARDTVRIIVPSAASADPPLLDRMALYGPTGLEYRSLDRPPPS